ncbi:permease, partial [Staphylococcus epidermidis]|uniref:permease n=1 Tax=Staphylococcus epidermidis TaxID=1282 RepID=UPI0016434484
FIILTFIVTLIQQLLSQDKIKTILTKPNQPINYFFRIIFPAITPFSSSSTIPILPPLLNSKLPFPPPLTFLIPSPLINPLMLFMLSVLFPWKLPILYFILLPI